MLFVNAGPVPLHAIVSACQSPKSALILVRLLAVPPMAVPPGLLAAGIPPVLTVIPGKVIAAVPWKATVFPDAWAGANTIKVTGLVILSAEIGTLPGKILALIP